MERLTEYESIGGHAHAIPTGDIDTALMRLSDYEDTGLTPAEVRSMYGEWQAMMSVLNSIGGYDRLRELAEADKEGRVAVLRCKPGDKAYLTRAWYKQAVNPIEATVTQVVTYGGDRLVYTMRPSDGSTWEFADEDVGRLVCLTLEEAEKASEEAD